MKRAKVLGTIVEFDRLLGFVFGFDFTGWRLVIRCTVSGCSGLTLTFKTDRQPKSYASLTQLWLGTHYLSIWR
jgi:hypothetical protein